MSAQDDNHVAAGWNIDHDLRWIEAGRLRLEEVKDGAVVFIRAPGSDGPTWLSATELAGLTRQIAAWFVDDPAEKIQQIEEWATTVKTELVAWDDRARIDEEHPPYDKLVRTLDMMIGACKRLRADNLFAERPTKQGTIAARLRDRTAAQHPGYPAFCSALREREDRVDESLNQAWESFKRGWRT